MLFTELPPQRVVQFDMSRIQHATNVAQVPDPPHYTHPHPRPESSFSSWRYRPSTIGLQKRLRLLESHRVPVDCSASKPAARDRGSRPCFPPRHEFAQ